MFPSLEISIYTQWDLGKLIVKTNRARHLGEDEHTVLSSDYFLFNTILATLTIRILLGEQKG